MKLREILKSVFLIALLFIITACKEPNIADIKLSDYDIKQDVDDFNINDLTLEVIFDDNTIDIVKVTEDMLPKEDLDKLNNIGIHEINIKYLDKVIPLHINLTDYYNVTYIVDGEIVETQVVEHGKDALFPDESLTNKEGYTFIGWNHDGKNITKDTTIECTYEISKYEVKFIYAGEVIETQIVEHGKDAKLPNEPSKQGYIFLGWDKDFINITENTIIEGIYELMKFQVEFYYDGELIDTQIVEYGSYATPPELKVKEWHIFLGWYWIDSPITFNKNINAKVDYIEGGRFLEYKDDTKNEIKEYLKVSKEILNVDERNLIDSYINDGCNKIDIAVSEEEVDNIAKYTKQLIEHIGAKYYEDNFERMPGEEKFTEGNGTYENPYIIDTKGKLIYFSNNSYNGIGLLSHYELKTDIDLEGVVWMPIDLFYGHFNGNGFEVSNITITKELMDKIMIVDYYYAIGVGLFSYNGGIIENLGVKNIDIQMEWSILEGEHATVYAGGIVGLNWGIVKNCYSFGNIKLDYTGESQISRIPNRIYAGGISGTTEENAIVSSCYSQINIDISYVDESGAVRISGISGGPVDRKSGKLENSFGVLTYTCIYKPIKHPVFHNTESALCVATGFGIDNENCYGYRKKILTLWEKATNDLNSLEFYTERLGWSEEVWDLSNIEFKDGKFLEDCYPKLKRNKNA